MKLHSNLDNKSSVLKLEQLLKDFDHEGTLFSGGARNTIKTFDFEGKKISIKSFKIPNLVNKIAYKFLRKSKAQRSYEYATKLLEMQVGTPKPIAYAEEAKLLFNKSFYACDLLDCDLTYRDLVDNPKYAGETEILKAFTQFTFSLHEKGIHFLDHSPGNTLIVKNAKAYEFYLVDLNRMEFKPMDYTTRIKNFSRLTPKKKMVVVMAKEYARLAGYDEQKTISDMWKATKEFQEGFHRKKRLKKKLRFWK
ncbi:lipopolysaccharide kinase InaA family protein [Flavimarina sp. Hel_I_48]|uniref:lipopolysaccharide kinase InaA family protein n=1 Tax=Flavimarina sp. Hel_I_48 TaxID=1392488 RepID=UPI0004DF73B5|nr:lipopolysaccharide kinase InaA family protein [Flavimarina sp. Hel_I_48]